MWIPKISSSSWNCPTQDFCKTHYADYICTVIPKLCLNVCEDWGKVSIHWFVQLDFFSMMYRCSHAKVVCIFQSLCFFFQMFCLFFMKWNKDILMVCFEEGHVSELSYTMFFSWSTCCNYLIADRQTMCVPRIVQHRVFFIF